MQRAVQPRRCDLWLALGRGPPVTGVVVRRRWPPASPFVAPGPRSVDTADNQPCCTRAQLGPRRRELRHRAGMQCTRAHSTSTQLTLCANAGARARRAPPVSTTHTIGHQPYPLADGVYWRLPGPSGCPPRGSARRSSVERRGNSDRASPSELGTRRDPHARSAHWASRFRPVPPPP